MLDVNLKLGTGVNNTVTASDIQKWKDEIYESEEHKQFCEKIMDLMIALVETRLPKDNKGGLK